MHATVKDNYLIMTRDVKDKPRVPGDRTLDPSKLPKGAYNADREDYRLTFNSRTDAEREGETLEATYHERMLNQDFQVFPVESITER